MNGFTFDARSNYEYKNLILCNPDKSEIAILTPQVYKGLKLTLRFNEFSELEFSVFSRITQKDNLIDYPYYTLFVKNRVINLDGIGYFIITSTTETVEYDTRVKDIKCKSLEYSLNSKAINLLDGTYKLYNSLNANDTTTLLGSIISNLPNWAIGTVSASLWNKYRTFEIPSTTVYSFLMNELESAYECIVCFDTNNQTINVYDAAAVVNQTDIVLKFDNLVKKITIEENESDIITALAVYGSDDVSIRSVNPLGTAFIYNFDYYKSWMSSELKTVLDAWEAQVVSQATVYATNLSTLKTKQSELITLQSQLVDLQGELAAIDQVRTAQMPNILSSTTQQYNAKQAEITAKERDITTKQNEITSIRGTLTEINISLQFSNNFTTAQLKELDNYIFEQTYQNENYVTTNLMDAVDIQNMSEQLLEQGKSELNKLAQPSYIFKMDVANFLFIEKYQPFIEQLQLGSILNVEVKQGEWVAPIVLEISVDYDSPDNFSMTFGNRYRLSDASWNLSDLMASVNKSSTSVSANSSIWSQPVKSGIIDEVSDYMDNALNLTRQEIVNSSNNEVTLGEYGMRLRRLLQSGESGYVSGEKNYDPVQVWLYNKGMAFTVDNWNSASAFFGTITVNGNQTTGLIADKVVGNLMAGNQLSITNENNTFTVDGNGATLVNASLTLNALNNKSKIVMNPTDGIKIQTNTGSWKDSFYVDTVGNLTLSGTLITESGSIGKWDISSEGLVNGNNGDYIKSNGYVKLGMLTMTPSSARFDGNIFADNLDDYGITQDKIGSREITTRTLGNNAVTPEKLDRVYATEGDFDILSARVATLNDVVADKLDVDNLEAAIASLSYVTVRNLAIHNYFGFDGKEIECKSAQIVKSISIDYDEDEGTTSYYPVYGRIFYLAWADED